MWKALLESTVHLNTFGTCWKKMLLENRKAIQHSKVGKSEQYMLKN